MAAGSGDDRRRVVGVAPFDHQFFAQVTSKWYARVAFAHRPSRGRVGVGRQAAVHLHDQQAPGALRHVQARGSGSASGAVRS